MTDDRLVDRGLDRPDEDENPGGSESQYYPPSTPYQCKNAPSTPSRSCSWSRASPPALLFGNDKNRNGKLDPDEEGTGSAVQPGWAGYLTVYSREPNIAADGTARVNLNGTDLAQLKDDLTAATDETPYLILAFRLFGSGSSGGGMGMGKGANTQPGTLSQLKTVVDEALKNNTQPRQNVSSVFALVNAKITIQIPNPIPNMQPLSVQVTSPLQNDPGLQREVLPRLLDKTTTESGTELPAKVNVNTAPREVLLTLPGLTESEVDAILVRRPTYTNGQSADATFDTIAWLLTDAQVPVATMQSLERYVTARTQVYRVQAIGYFDQGGPVSRVEAVIDVNGGKPRIAYFRDLTDLGRSIDPRTPVQDGARGLSEDPVLFGGPAEPDARSEGDAGGVLTSRRRPRRCRAPPARTHRLGLDILIGWSRAAAAQRTGTRGPPRRLAGWTGPG